MQSPGRGVPVLPTAVHGVQFPWAREMGQHQQPAFRLGTNG